MLRFFGSIPRVTPAGALALILLAQVGSAPRPVELDALLGQMVELSPDLADAVLAVRTAAAEERRARALFDLSLGGEANAAQSVLNSPSLGQIFGALEVREALRAEKAFSTGTRASLEQQLVHGAAPNALRGVEAALGLSTPGQYLYDFSTVTLTITQPLLRGVGGGATLAAYRAAVRGVDAARRRRLAALADASVRAAAAYAALYVRERELEIASGASERDAQELSLTQKRISLGIVPSSDLLRRQQVQASHAEREIAARLAVADAERALRSALGLPEGGDRIATAVSPAASPAPSPSREAAASAAVASHPSVLAAREEVERRREQLTRAQDAARPSLDLSAYAGTTGFDPGNPAGALAQTVRVQRAIYGVGLTFRYPLDNSVGQADVEQASAELARAETAQRRVEQEAARSAAALADAVESASARLALAEKAAALAAQALAAERDRYGQGRGTLFDVLSAEAAASDAERARAQARADLVLARFSLRAATGELALELSR